MSVNVSKICVEGDFLKADEAIEALHAALRYTNQGQSVSEGMSRLEEIYRRGNEEVRYKILTDLIEIEYTGARSLLIEALQSDESALVRHEAAFGLGVLGNQTHASILVHATLNDDNLMVRHEAAIALASAGREGALGALVKASRDSRPEVAASARYAIQSIYLKAHHESDDT